jgi:hypothetical protein
LNGSAYTTATDGYTQTVGSDPVVQLMTDVANQSSHMNVTLSNPDYTNFQVSQFAKVDGRAASASQSIAVGPSPSWSNLGDAWLLGNGTNSNGDHLVFHRVNGIWYPLSAYSGTEIADGPAGYPWLINHAGAVFCWNGSAFQVVPGNVCATHIAVGPNAYGSSYGDPWITGCHEQVNGYNIYRLEYGSFVIQSGQAAKIALGSKGPWIVQLSGLVYFWNGSQHVQAPGNPCASDIAVAPISGWPNTSIYGDPWILGCHAQSAGYNIYQLQGNKWVGIAGEATAISVSPDFGIPWIVDNTGTIYE